MTRLYSRAGSALQGRVRVPGDKSISHRAIMLASIAEGLSRIEGFLEGEDTRATARAFAAMGVRIEAPNPSQRIVHGVGLHGLRAASQPLDMGNAGTGMRLLAGLLAGQRFDSTLVGDASLSRRPMRRVVEPLTRMGAKIATAEEGRPPLRIQGAQTLRAIDYSTPVASAQVKSCLLLAGLYAQGETLIREAHPTRDHSERMLADFGIELDAQESCVSVRGGQILRACDVSVPADISSATFPLLAATLVPGSDITLSAVGINPRRSAVIDTLRDMGANIELLNRGLQGREPVADIRVRSARLYGIDVPEQRVADMIDEFPALFVAAAMARGSTRIRGVAELRVKESDRIAVMSQALRTLGVDIEEHPDGATIQGGGLHGGSVDSAGDHRCAMSLLIAGLCCEEGVSVEDCDNVATSFPGFVELMVGLGARMGSAHEAKAER